MVRTGAIGADGGWLTDRRIGLLHAVCWGGRRAASAFWTPHAAGSDTRVAAMDQTRASEPQPDLNDLVNALTRETEVDRTLRASPAQVMGIPRPMLLTRLLVVLVVLLIGGMAGLMIWLTGHVHALVVDLRMNQQGSAVVRQPPLPPADELLADDRFVAVLAKAPDQAVRLFAARGQALLLNHRAVEAMAAFAAADRRSDRPLAVIDRLAWASAQLDGGEPQAARATVLAIDHAMLTPAERALAADLLTRCVQATRRVE